jgi:hypothetical protein
VDPRDIRYYLTQGLPIASFAPSMLQQLVCSRERSGRLVLERQLTAAAWPVKPAVFGDANAARRLVKQRGYGCWISVWSIGAARPQGAEAMHGSPGYGARVVRVKQTARSQAG